jgi:hypothetical protein
VLVEVRKPGRPLSSCPHPTGSCSCERVVINYTIPKTSECACPSERVQPPLAPTSSARIQKNRNRKSTSTFNAIAIERALKGGQDGETDSSSLFTQTPPSESISPPSSASSTPRLLPLRKNSQSSEIPAMNSPVPDSRPTTALLQGVSSCCQPKPMQPVQTSQGGGGCCSKNIQEAPKPAQPTKSCCSGAKSAPPIQTQFAPQNGQMNAFNGYSPYPGRFQPQPYGIMNQHNFVPMTPPPNFNTPIYNHVGSIYHPAPSMPGTPMASHAGTHATEHNCHCGDGCSCFGCAAHPNNATMMEYIRSMHQWMSTGQFGTRPPPFYDVPTYPHQAGYGAEAGLAYSNVTPTHFPPASHISYQTNRTTTLPSQTWSQASISTPVQAPPLMGSHYFGPTNSANPIPLPDPTSSLQIEESVQSPTFADSPGSGKDEETVTLSPSSFFWQEVVLPGCNDATGTCQCGDGCDCVGCLTHGGHNGVPLDLPTVGAEKDAFAEFDPSTIHDPNVSNGFLSYPNTPT